MSIDRIGKGAGIQGPQGPQGGGPSGAVGGKRAFEVESTQGAERAAALGPAERVRAGELSLEGYLDVRAAEATRHLEGKLGPSDLNEIRSLLKEQLRSDPALRDLVKAATGGVPAGREGDEG
ncbi:MAG TPA: hypothetical protein VFS00_32995 [Polyangiaceae bacterium]|nr:hypothetical protein [Polyangiaceae bacterium]